MKIYTVYENEIYALEVRETERLFITEGRASLAFDCQHRFIKKNYRTTPEEAVELAISRILTTIVGTKDKLIQLEADLCMLRKLSEESNH